MARGLGLTALRVALGGLSGVGQDRAAMREAQRVEQEQARALERQRMLDRSMLQREGYEETGIMDQLRAGGREATFRTVFGPPEQRRPGDARAVAAALESAMPRQTITMDGQQFERTSPRALELRQAEQEQMRERNKQLTARQEQDAERAANVQALVTAGIPEERARAAVRSGAKYGDMFMTPGEQSRERLGLAQLGVEREKARKTETGKPRFGEVSSLRKEFNTETRPYKTINDALKNIEALGAKRNPTPQDDQALIYQFVKAQDPTSVVRESEYANAQSAIALTDRITSYAQRLQTGQKLTPTQRADMVRTARLLRQEAMSQYRSLADSYEALATSFGMEPKTIVANRLDRGFDAAQAAAKPSAADALAKLRGGR